MKPLASPSREDSRTLASDARVTRNEADDYQRRATMHRPSCVRCMERAARDLMKQGLKKPADISQALGISAAAVGQLLQAETR